MSKTSKAFDDYLFAPARYLTQAGNIVHGNKYKNALLMPEIKVGALSVVCLGLAFASANLKDKTPAVLISGAAGLIPAFFFAKRREKLDELKYYFDTAPDKRMPIPSLDIKRDLNEKRDHLLSYTIFRAATASIVIPALNVFIGDLKLTSALVGVNYSIIVTKDISMWWYAKQVQEGNWNVITQQTGTGKKTATGASHNLAPAPRV